MKHYTYAYLREDGTPYYIGLGSGYRITSRNKRCIKPPRDRSRVIYLKKNISLEEARKHEIYMISVYGRKDLGTGILYNRTNGGEGVMGLIPNEKQRAAALKNGIRPPKDFILEEIATGKIIKGTNITAFCRERKLGRSSITRVINGQRVTAYGFRLPSVL